MIKTKKTLYKGTFILAVGMVTFLCCGIMNVWSILKAPLADSFGWLPSQLAMNFTISFSFFCLGGYVGSMIFRRISFRFTMILSALLIMAGETIASRIGNQDLLLLYLGSGVLCGSGIGMAYNAVISVVFPWFPGRTGLCSGLLMMCYGVSSLIMGTLAEKMIYSPSIGWRNTYLFLGLFIGGVTLLAAFLMRLPGAGEVIASATEQKNAAASTETKKDFTSGEMLRSSNFYLLFFYLVFTAAVGNSFFSFTRDYAMEAGFTAAAASAMVGVCSVCNGIGRILSGFAFDRFGRRTVMMISNLISILAPLAALLTVFLQAVWLGVITICLMGACYGICPIIAMAGTSDFFGAKYYSTNLGILNFNLMAASFCASITGVIITHTGGFTQALLFLLCLSGGALVLNILLNCKKGLTKSRE